MVCKFIRWTCEANDVSTRRQMRFAALNPAHLEDILHNQKWNKMITLWQFTSLLWKITVFFKNHKSSNHIRPAIAYQTVVYLTLGYVARRVFAVQRCPHQSGAKNHPNWLPFGCNAKHPLTKGSFSNSSKKRSKPRGAGILRVRPSRPRRRNTETGQDMKRISNGHTGVTINNQQNDQKCCY